MRTAGEAQARRAASPSDCVRPTFKCSRIELPAEDA
jgi:hypothetical protein